MHIMTHRIESDRPGRAFLTPELGSALILFFFVGNTGVSGHVTSSYLVTRRLVRCQKIYTLLLLLGSKCLSIVIVWKYNGSSHTLRKIP